MTRTLFAYALHITPTYQSFSFLNEPIIRNFITVIMIRISNISGSYEVHGNSSNLLKMRNSNLGSSAPSLTDSLVNFVSILQSQQFSWSISVYQSPGSNNTIDKIMCTKISRSIQRPQDYIKLFFSSLSQIHGKIDVKRKQFSVYY